jgi:hypothetical protein
MPGGVQTAGLTSVRSPGKAGYPEGEDRGSAGLGLEVV